MWGGAPTFFLDLRMSHDLLLSRIRDHVVELGYELADFRQDGRRQRPILQVRIDRPGSEPGRGVTADDCVAVARALRGVLERERLADPGAGLDVSSPGIERPLRWPEHWRRFTGARARVRAPGLPGRTVVTIVGVPDD